MDKELQPKRARRTGFMGSEGRKAWQAEQNRISREVLALISSSEPKANGSPDSLPSNME